MVTYVVPSSVVDVKILVTNLTERVTVSHPDGLYEDKLSVTFYNIFTPVLCFFFCQNVFIHHLCSELFSGLLPLSALILRELPLRNQFLPDLNDSLLEALKYSCHHPDAMKTTFHRNSAVLKSSEEFTSRYKQEELLGEGGFSQKDVQLVKQAAGRLCDGSFENPAVIGFMDVFHLETEVIIIMERPPDTVNGLGYLKYLFQIKHIPEDQVKVIFQQITNAALLMHKNGVFHRDLKLENILVNRSKGTPEIRVIDFGCGDFVKNEPFSKFSGTPEYRTPESFRGETYKAEATTVWQIGAMLYMTCTIECFDTSVYMKKDKEVLENVSKECNDFLYQCLALDPNQRPTLEDLLLHPCDAQRKQVTGTENEQTLHSVCACLDIKQWIERLLFQSVPPSLTKSASTSSRECACIQRSVKVE
uniref:non-specific serine/threonine protein kinase n=1 Tax=Gouania willdenowi TaxID=441366 RepID=A0A8C5E438_GOUWI